MKYDEVYAFFMPKLEQELPSYLTYHNAKHTKHVIQVVQQLAKLEKVSTYDYQLLRTAALFHDAGFLETFEGHEEVSCKIANESLPLFDYSQEQIEQICRLIMATKIPQTPVDRNESILCDADLSYLGTDEFFPVAESVFLELKHNGKVKSWEDWQKLQLDFLESHYYHSPSAIKLYTAKKSHNFLLFKSGVHKSATLKSKRLHALQDSILIVFGIIVTAIGLNGFLVPAHFFDGGVTGIALLFYAAFNFDLSIMTFVLNLPFVFASYFIVNRTFAIKALIGIVLLSISLYFVPYQEVTQDKILIAIFGGFFIGAGSGLAMRAGSVLDGTEILALYTLKRTSFTIAEIILAINIIIFSVAALVESLEAALYSILTFMVASKTIDYVVDGVDAYIGVSIISGRSEIMKHRLVNEIGRSITIYKGERGYFPGNITAKSECDIIFMVIKRLELRKLKNLVYETDPNAFVFANTIREASGGILKRQKLVEASLSDNF